MAYEPQTWETGHRITAEKMNHIEQGIANSGGGTPLVVHNNEGTLDHTWQEIYDAMPNVMLGDEVDGVYVKNNAVFVHNIGDIYTVKFCNMTETFTTPDPNGYPVSKA